jgi:hypothetical protein
MQVMSLPVRNKNDETVFSSEAGRSRVGHPASTATKDESGIVIFMSRIANSGHFIQSRKF